ncbi:MAG: hypothetical protein U9R21_08955 [Candidatus Thermoplasmatota archaeon]|nr:hypothetical protein [Candidatus Thermoplasmatota archaeon]
MGGEASTKKRKKFAEAPTFMEKKNYRPKDVKETGLAFIGHEISEDGNTMNQFLHYDQLYTIRHGWNSKFFIGLLEGKIWGTRCPKCGDTWVPVRTHCWNLDCNLEKTEWVEMPLTAKVHTWTIAGWSGRSSLKRLPIVLVYAIIGNSKVAIANELHGIDPWDVEFGMPLKIVFKPKEERSGIVTDFHFEPTGDWKPSPMNEEKERIKQLVEPVYEWVKTLK